MILFFASAVENTDDQKRLRIVLRNGGFALLVFSLLALYFFSHEFSNYWTLAAYKWLRDSRIAEITGLPNGVFRFFMQSMIILVIGVCMTLYRFIQEKSRIWLFGIVSATVLVISLSRSYALGVVGAIISLVIMLIGSRQGRLVARSVARVTVVLVGGVALYVLVLKFPLPAIRSQESFQQLLNSRGGATREAASASRWALLPKLNEKIVESPIWGSGFGTTVTYQSSDPRIIKETGGTYTTDAFEWGYHDVLVKMGFIGLIAYAYLLWIILARLWGAPSNERLWLIPAFFALLVINVTSPYLNHPLGIGYLALLYAFAQHKKTEPLPVPVIVRVPQPEFGAAVGVATTELS
jgi:O-antigen ligase